MSKLHERLLLRDTASIQEDSVVYNLSDLYECQVWDKKGIDTLTEMLDRNDSSEHIFKFLTERIDGSINELWDNSEDDMSDWELDREHVNTYGGDPTYCNKCGARLAYDLDGDTYCPDCDAIKAECQKWLAKGYEYFGTEPLNNFFADEPEGEAAVLYKPEFDLYLIVFGKGNTMSIEGPIYRGENEGLEEALATYKATLTESAHESESMLDWKKLIYNFLDFTDCLKSGPFAESNTPYSEYGYSWSSQVYAEEFIVDPKTDRWTYEGYDSEERKTTRGEGTGWNSYIDFLQKKDLYYWCPIDKLKIDESTSDKTDLTESICKAKWEEIPEEVDENGNILEWAFGCDDNFIWIDKEDERQFAIYTTAESNNPSKIYKTLASAKAEAEKKWHSLYDNEVNEELTEDYAAEPDFTVDLVGYVDDDLEKYDVLETIPITVKELKDRYGDKTYELITKGFTREFFNGQWNMINTEFGHCISSIASQKMPWQERNAKYPNYKDYGYGYENLKLVNKDLFDTSIQALRKELGCKLLPPSGWIGHRNESLTEDYKSDHIVKPRDMDRPEIQELIRVFPSSERYFNEGMVMWDNDFSEFNSLHKNYDWYTESTYDALESAGYKMLETNSTDYTWGLTCNGEWVISPIADSYQTINIYKAKSKHKKAYETGEVLDVFNPMIDNPEYETGFVVGEFRIHNDKGLKSRLVVTGISEDDVNTAAENRASSWGWTVDKLMSLSEPIKSTDNIFSGIAFGMYNDTLTDAGKEQLDKLRQEHGEYLNEALNSGLSVRDIAEAAEDFLSNEKHLWCELADYDEANNTFTLYIDGDWKHDHLRADYLLREQFSDDYDIIKVDEVVTEETDDDSYPSLHKYQVTNTFTLSVDGVPMSYKKFNKRLGLSEDLSNISDKYQIETIEDVLEGMMGNADDEDIDAFMKFTRKLKRAITSAKTDKDIIAVIDPEIDDNEKWGTFTDTSEICDLGEYVVVKEIVNGNIWYWFANSDCAIDFLDNHQFTFDESLCENTKSEWKPNISFKHIKQIYDKVKNNNYKFVNNEREEFMTAVSKCEAGNGTYTPEQRKQIRDWHREIRSQHRLKEATTVKNYTNKRNPNKHMEEHDDGYGHHSFRQYMKWNKGDVLDAGDGKSFVQDRDLKNFTGDGNLHRAGKNWRKEVIDQDYALDEAMKDDKYIGREAIFNCGNSSEYREWGLNSKKEFEKEIAPYDGENCTIIASTLAYYDEDDFLNNYWEIKFADGTILSGVSGYALDLFDKHLDNNLIKESLYDDYQDELIDLIDYSDALSEYVNNHEKEIVELWYENCWDDLPEDEKNEFADDGYPNLEAMLNDTANLDVSWMLDEIEAKEKKTHTEIIDSDEVIQEYIDKHADELRDSEAYMRDPYSYNGVSRSDF